ncbi:hypothetical protein SLEP1_g30378 [Rubroshorea leprosula]|uniref:DUF4220 domain-containing protein n=1 Tax=Rubroshorea leprosula TaxID=152421 RepID=A0AAV5K9R2_9ROSI|nr:hypothetical protein SLEP1_g30378 [Rubroshorea leprosula]
MMVEMVPSPVRKFWKEWELVGAAVLSLTLQIVLITTGNRRKYIRGTWFRIIVWFAYMMADSVATIALGILSNDLGQIYHGEGHNNLGTNALIYDDKGHMNVGTKAYINEGTKLKAFWAPFFLLHLGGPDTITAYSLEDNELFLRHLAGLIVQTITALYIILLAWTSSHISYLSIAVIVVGCIKYGERTFSLWKASWNKLQNTILTDPDPGPNYSRFMEEYESRDEEGFFVDIIETKEGQGNLDEIVPETTTDDMVKAHDLFQTFKSLFADLILSFHDRTRSQDLFKKLTDKNAFKVIEIELGFMYDLLFTKAPVIYTPWGLARRFITFSLTSFAFLSFILDDKLRHKGNTIDFVVTSLLLVVAVLLEIYAALVVLFSDETRTWWIKRRKSTAQPSNSRFKEWFKWFKVKSWFTDKRWSNSMAQYSLLRLSLKEKHSIRITEEFCYKKYKKFTEEYRKLIFDHVKDKFDKFDKLEKNAKLEPRSTSTLDTVIRELCSQRGKGIIEKYQKQKNKVALEWGILEWSVSVEFDQSILIWHMATEICYYSENLSDDVKLSGNFSLHMSRYMLYLLVICPFMLPAGIGFIRFRDTCAEAMEFFNERMSTSWDEGRTSRDRGTVSGNKPTSPSVNKSRGWSFLPQPNFLAPFLPTCSSSSVVDVEERRKKACKSLLEVRTDVPPIKVKGDRSKSVLFDACRLARTLGTISGSDQAFKWNLIKDMWLELLAYAACHCSGNDHARQLGKGGELLTHVWLLMAHFGLTEQFQISQGHARARLVTK